MQVWSRPSLTSRLNMGTSGVHLVASTFSMPSFQESWRGLRFQAREGRRREDHADIFQPMIYQLIDCLYRLLPQLIMYPYLIRNISYTSYSIHSTCISYGIISLPMWWQRFQIEESSQNLIPEETKFIGARLRNYHVVIEWKRSDVIWNIKNFGSLQVNCVKIV